MAIWILLLSILAAGAALSLKWRATRVPIGAIAILIGISVFAIRLFQPGAYAFPSGGNLISGVLALGLGTLLLTLSPRMNPEPSPPDGPSDRVSAGRTNGAVRIGLLRTLLAASPLVLFVALYSTLAEVEEVVVLHSTHEQGHAVDLRLWIVEDDGAGWIQMPIEKANAHGLDETEIDMTRDGNRDCVKIKRFTDLANTRRVQNLRYEKYIVQRLATLIGVFPREPTGGAAILRVTECTEQSR